MDTVFDLGMLEKNPYREEDGRLYGPGILDMKCSIAMMLAILRVYQQQGIRPARPLTILFSSDEEIGSQTSRKMIEELGRQSALALCLEPALASGAIKTARKGTGDIHLHVQGVPAHAGIDHARGRNAIEELAYHVIEAQKLTDYARGTTVNVGVVRGGTRGNVVPAEAEALIDFRVNTMEEAERLRQWAAKISPVIEGTVLAADLSINRPPMPRNDMIAAAFDKARKIAQELGFSLQEGSTGGGSDANFVAPLGIPVLDGLGGVGDGAHSDREYVLLNSLVERTALVAALILNA
jgi:glutamate carboxypeptidase